MHFLVLLSCFASNKRDVTIIINYENILQLMTTLFLSVKAIKNNHQFSEPFWHSYWLESAGNGVLRLSDLKIF